MTAREARRRVDELFDKADSDQYNKMLKMIEDAIAEKRYNVTYPGKLSDKNRKFLESKQFNVSLSFQDGDGDWTTQICW